MCTVPSIPKAPVPSGPTAPAPTLAPQLQIGDVTGLGLGQRSAARGFADLRLQVSPSVTVGSK